jgi:predicted nucleotide-binding protein
LSATTLLPQNLPTKSPQDSPDPRSVFVVHGRNGTVRRAMFDFLRALGLSPIEWDEAVAMTGQGAPYTGYAIDAAFSNAHAAVILITGDDLACLKPEFISEDDDDSERKPTPQARPNVLFEMGLAFGRKPDRTIIVEFGKTRLMSDTLGRNVIRFSDTPEFRQKLAARLRTAGCAVNADSRLDWLSAKFDFPSS